jgi:hypothetical protein
MPINRRGRTGTETISLRSYRMNYYRIRTHKTIDGTYNASLIIEFYEGGFPMCGRLLRLARGFETRYLARKAGRQLQTLELRDNGLAVFRCLQDKKNPVKFY